jgi:hypothetical protein
MNYQSLKFLEDMLDGLLKNGEKKYSKEFLSAVREMLNATKKLMKFF